jgi:hypothetical protein
MKEAQHRKVDVYDLTHMCTLKTWSDRGIEWCLPEVMGSTGVEEAISTGSKLNRSKKFCCAIAQ